MIHATAIGSPNMSTLNPPRASNVSFKRAIQRLIQPAFNRIETNNPKTARLICNLIPANCPFERDVVVFGRKFHIPAMCKLNPAYEQLVELRFKALCFLADECGEDVTPYCQ
jgi:Mo-dependent nitrogenase C-terminus